MSIVETLNGNSKGELDPGHISTEFHQMFFLNIIFLDASLLEAATSDVLHGRQKPGTVAKNTKEPQKPKHFCVNVQSWTTTQQAL